MNVPRVQEMLSQMARYGEAASAEIGNDPSDVCRAAMDLLMLQIGIVYWLTNDHQRNRHSARIREDGEKVEKPPWLQGAKKSGP